MRGRGVLGGGGLFALPAFFSSVIQFLFLHEIKGGEEPGNPGPFLGSATASVVVEAAKAINLVSYLVLKILVLRILLK